MGLVAARFTRVAARRTARSPAVRQMNWIARSWSRIAGIPARSLARRLAARFSHDSYDGIALLLGDATLEKDATRYFEFTREALAAAAARAPKSYAALRKDVRSIVMWAGPPRPPYHPLQLAAIVPADVALGSDVLCYAAWLLYASGLSRSEQHALARAQELLDALEPDQRRRVGESLGGLRSGPDNVP